MNRNKKRTVKKNCFVRYCAGIVASVLMLMLFAVSVMAYQNPDTTKMGSVELTLVDNTSKDPVPVKDGEMELVLVALGKVDNGLYTLVPQGAFDSDDFNVDISIFSETDLSSKDVADRAESFVKAHDAEIPASQRWKANIQPDGTVSWTDLSLGLYLVRQTKRSEGYELLSSFLVTVPLVQKDGEGNVTGYIYDVDATPKVEPPTPTPPPQTPTPTPPPGTLPYTGQLWWPVWMLTGIGAVLIVIGIIIVGHRRRSNR